MVFFALLGVGLSAGSAVSDPGQGTLFATTRTNDLITINTADGSPTLVGPMGAGTMPGLAADPNTSILYGGHGQGIPEVYRIDPSNGAATLIGNSGLGFAAIPALDFSLDGVLYASVNIVADGGTGGDHLATINTANGMATVIGPYGTCGGEACDFEGMEAIAFNASGTLYGATANSAGLPGLYTIDVNTGHATLVALIFDAAGSPPGGGVSALQFGCDGVLYGGTARSTGQTNGGQLIAINPVTGVFTVIGQAIADGSSLLSLAFSSPCVVPVEPRHWGDVKNLFR
jgi:hypothetical protein